MKMVNFVVDPNNVKESFGVLTHAVTGNAEAIEILNKANKRLAFGLFCLSVSGMLIYMVIKSNSVRITALENQVVELMKQAQPNSEPDIPESE